MANDKFLYYAVNNDFILLPYIFQFREFVQPLLISMYIILRGVLTPLYTPELR